MGFHAVNFVWLNHTNIGGARKLLLVALAHKVDDDSGECWPSISTLSEMVACKDRAVRKQMADLEEIGAIKRQHREGRSNKYRLTGYLEWHKQVKSISKPVLTDIPAESDTPVHMDSPPVHTDSPPVPVDIPTPVHTDSQSISSINQKASTKESTTKSTPPQSLPVPTRARTHEGEGASLQSIKDQLLLDYYGRDTVTETNQKQAERVARELHKVKATLEEITGAVAYVKKLAAKWPTPANLHIGHVSKHFDDYRTQQANLKASNDAAVKYYAKPDSATFQAPAEQSEAPAPPVIEPSFDPPEPGELPPPEPEIDPDKWRLVVAQVKNFMSATEKHYADGMRLAEHTGNKFVIAVKNADAKKAIKVRYWGQLMAAIAYDYQTAVRMLSVDVIVTEPDLRFEVPGTVKAQEAAA